MVCRDPKGACQLVRERDEKLEPVGASDAPIRCLRCSQTVDRNEVTLIRVETHSIPLCKHCWGTFWKWLPSQGRHEGCFDPLKERAGYGANFCETCRLEFERWLGPAAQEPTHLLGRSIMARQGKEGKKAKGTGQGAPATVPPSQPAAPASQTSPSTLPPVQANPSPGAAGTAAPKKEQA